MWEAWGDSRHEKRGMPYSSNSFIRFGKWRIQYILCEKKYFPNEKMAIIKGVKRHQGFIVEKGNPHNIRDFLI